MNSESNEKKKKKRIYFFDNDPVMNTESWEHGRRGYAPNL